MPGPIMYIDSSDVRDGVLDELREAIGELVEFIEENEPQLLAYNVYLSDDGQRMNVVHLHADAESLDLHMDVAGPKFERFQNLISLHSIHVYGEPSEKARVQLMEKAEMLGDGGEVATRGGLAGFSRIHPPRA